LNAALPSSAKVGAAAELPSIAMDGTALTGQLPASSREVRMVEKWQFGKVTDGGRRCDSILT
jgi:hypothetical protein